MSDQEFSPDPQNGSPSADGAYGALFSRAKVAMLMIDPADGSIVDANMAALAFYGHDLDTLRRMRISDINILTRDEIAAEMALAQSERRSHFFFRHRLSNGLIRHVEVHSGPIRVAGRSLLYSIIHDITERRQAEDLVRRLNRRFRDVVDAATEVAIIATDRTGLISIFNSGAERMLGWRAEEMIDRRTPLDFHDLSEVQQRMQELSAHVERQVQPFEAFVLVPRMVGQERRQWHYIRKDGSRFPVSLVVTPIRNEQDQITGYVGIALDMSQQVAAEQRVLDSEARYHEIFADSPQPMWVYDTEQQRFLDVNRAAMDQYGYTSQQFVTLTLADIVVGSDSLASGQQRHRTCSGDEIDVQVWTRRLPGAEQSAKIALLVNVTEANRAQQAILSANRQLDQQAAQLKQVNEELEQFAYVASHDLRQPLRMVTSYLSLLERQLASVLTADQQAYLGFARDGARRMDRLILDLLDYSRIGRLSSPRAAVDLADVLRDCQLNLQVALRESGAVLNLPDTLPTVTGHASELVRLFQNLIGNALKYHAPDVVPHIRLTCRELESHWQCSVQDNGIGIAEQDQPRIFAVFQRLVSEEQFEGTGIGLAVCKKIVTHHGGQIWVESQPGQGSVFHVTLQK